VRLGGHPVQRSGHLVRHRSRLPLSTLESLQLVADRAQVRWSNLLIAATALYVHRLSGARDLVLGLPVTARPDADLKRLPGMLSNLLPLRVAVCPELPWSAFLAVVTASVREALAHQRYRSEDICRDLGWRDSAGALFSPTINLVSFASELCFSGVAATRWNLSAGAAADLSIVVLDPRDGSGLEVDWAAHPAVFDADELAIHAGRFLHLLDTLAAVDPALPIGQVELLSPRERQQLIEWNRTATDFPVDLTVVELFEAQVQASPDAVALVFEDAQLSYRELNARANRLAHALIARGVGPEVLVALCVERSIDMVVGLLGILKAGGAYVPLDPDYPPERLAFMLADSAAPVLLTQRGLLERLPATGVATLALDDPQWCATQPAGNPLRRAEPHHLAYAIYTSGSTGRPKGVCLPHRALANHTHWMQRCWPLGATDRVLHKTTLAFDAAVWELWSPLAAGAVLVLCPPWLDDPRRIAATVRDRRIAVLQLVPALIEPLLDQDPQALAGLRHIFCGGEALSPARVQRLRRTLPATGLTNLYGPTEACIDAVYWSPAGDWDGTSVAIGKPVANARIYILDRGLQPLPIGVPGELCIAGAGLARGYLNRPELTAERFVEVELFGQTERLYRTGDLARWRPDGHLEYLGRLDHQVKLRGFRIELGEIESVLAQHPSVREAAVALHDSDGNPALAAYLTVASGQCSVDSASADPDPLTTDHASLTTALRPWLKSRLPDYMIPASFTVLDAFPLTPNGKLDRRALPAPDAPRGADAYAPPRNALEQQLADCWAAVLKRSDIGIHDNFFDLGGDSILSIQIIARARQAGLGLTPRDLFEHQSIAELALAVRPLASSDAEQGPVRGAVPLTPIQAWLFAQGRPAPWHFNQALLLTPPADFDADALRRALAAVLAHHDALRLRYRQVDGAWHQTHAAPDPDGALPFQVEELAGDDLAAALAPRADHWQASLDLTQGPLTRLVLCRHPQGTRLLWIVHHLAVDGVSWRILLDDLGDAYAQARRGAPVALPAKTSSFKAWSECLQRWAAGPALAAEADWWQRQLAAPTAPLPIDDPAAPNRESDLRHAPMTLDAATTRRLLEEAPAAYRTGIDDLLLAALLLALAEWSGAPRHVLDLESHGRAELFADIDLGRTVGWFTSLYSLALTLPAGEDLGAIIKSIKE